MPLDPELLAESPYLPEGLLLDEVLEIDAEAQLVRVRMPTHANLPLTNTQRVHPVRHPSHVSGGLMVHMTGMAALVYAFHVLKLRHAEGWVGYGVRIHHAKFVKLAPPGEPIEILCRALKVRRLGDKVFARFAFEFTQGGELVYESEQSALYQHVGSAAATGEA